MRPSPFGRASSPGAAIAAARARARAEAGQALVMAMAFVFVLSITLVVIVQATSSDSRDASRSASTQNAYALAEAGVNQALSVLALHGNDATQLKAQPQYAGDPGSTVTSFPNGGTVTWGGTFNQPTRTWTIKSIGSMRNPTGTKTSASLTRIISAGAQILPPPYSFASLNNACDQHSFIVRSSGQLTVTNPMYVNSCNSPQDAFDIFGPGGNISAPEIDVVGGWETHSGDTVTVNGVTCPLAHSSTPLTATQPTGCPKTAQTAIPDPFAGILSPPALGAPACSHTMYGAAASYAPTKQNLAAATTAAQTTIASTGNAVQTGDVIQVDSEQMLVTAGGGTTMLTVQRAYNGTTAAAHTSAKEIKHVPTSTGGTAAVPDACMIPSGSVTLQPGTYYGGICIGAAAGSKCGSNIGGTCTTTSSSTANVTLAAGNYVMAGGGFFVCGSSTLSAPNVLIYDTEDPTNTAGAGAIDQIELDTTGSVTLGPQRTGVYYGLTLYEDPSLSVAPTVTCGSKTQYATTPSATQIGEYDIALMSMGSSGANGPLGSISGTIYAPAYRAEFADAVGGTANIAVLTSCILIDGGTSTFAYQTDGLYGVGLHVLGQWG